MFLRISAFNVLHRTQFHTQTNVYFMMETYFGINNKSYANKTFIWYDQSNDDINVVSSEHALF